MSTTDRTRTDAPTQDKTGDNESGAVRGFVRRAEAASDLQIDAPPQNDCQIDSFQVEDDDGHVQLVVLNERETDTWVRGDFIDLEVCR